MKGMVTIMENKAGNNAFDAHVPNGEYLMLRKRSLDATPEMLGLDLPDDPNRAIVYGAVVDVALPDKILTLSCLGNGDLGIYYSNGGGILGLAQNFKSISEAMGSFIISSSQVISVFEKAYGFALPPENYNYIYLLTNTGVKYTSINILKINEEPKEKQFIFFLYQRIMEEVQKCAPKQKVDRKDGSISDDINKDEFSDVKVKEDEKINEAE
jgi:hypothetical protein